MRWNDGVRKGETKVTFKEIYTNFLVPELNDGLPHSVLPCRLPRHTPFVVHSTRAFMVMTTVPPPAQRINTCQPSTRPSALECAIARCTPPTIKRRIPSRNTPASPSSSTPSAPILQLLDAVTEPGDPRIPSERDVIEAEVPNCGKAHPV